MAHWASDKLLKGNFVIQPYSVRQRWRNDKESYIQYALILRDFSWESDVNMTARSQTKALYSE